VHTVRVDFTSKLDIVIDDECRIGVGAKLPQHCRLLTSEIPIGRFVSILQKTRAARQHLTHL
jgi:hypothetical protein